MTREIAKRATGAQATPLPRPAADAILAALPTAVLVLDGGGRVISANHAAEELLQTGIAQLQRGGLAEIVAAADPLLALVEHVARTSQPINEYGIEIALPRLGLKRRVDARARAMEPDRVLLTLVERSMPEMIERHLTHRTAARGLSHMSAVLAHEIKNPLSGIRGAAQLLEPGLDEEGRALAELICTETDRICRLVDDLAAFGDGRPRPKEAVNIHSVLDHVKRLALSGGGAHAGIIERYDPSLPPALGDRDRLVQAFLNLVRNALEATAAQPRDGRIVLQTAYRPGLRHSGGGGGRRGIGMPLVVTVEDNGPGVPEEIRDSLFEPFVTAKAKGTGLGLALVAKIIEEHGGLIEHEQLDRRTIFRVALPVSEQGE